MWRQFTPRHHSLCQCLADAVPPVSEVGDATLQFGYRPAVLVDLSAEHVPFVRIGAVQ
jgi:hypothetical protein